jgi:hypothetical protein
MCPPRVLIFVLIAVLVCLLAALAAGAAAPRVRELAPLLVLGAGPRKRRAPESETLVVDTLNLTHWLRRRTPLKRVETCDILAAIEETAPLLRRLYPGRVIYVTKDRETRVDKARAERLRALYQAAARRHGVYVHVVERLPGDAGAPRGRRSHAALGRDDFYLIMLAWKYKSAVLSRDRFRDLPDMKGGHLQSFQVYSYSPLKRLPERDFVNPAAAEFRRMRRPATVDYSKVLKHL